ncbi:xanthine dehydrogenase family protein molybdopterin-binding subunit [Sphingomonas crocodyli]|uniref:Xanthine dehydrogenase family protein molybdopterin-binding subunit n=1 Tax=Sphingomonas crocodyli TaxID=1979270 RepID=A0A437LXX3_9SPHN|nr:xanthine dehydrogenase family protein molybdopterin-binding subunit [Sphingomonas crocodyli]RVT90269.1 xanthine dehydrogenase family protein molybdopterin-binding subunit [Sphingomonas crocodyli]
MSMIGDAKAAVKGAIQGAMQKAIAAAPDSWMPGGTPDPLIREQHGHTGKPVSRIDGPLKVAGAAPFAAEFALEQMTYASVLFSTVARGRIATLDTVAAERAPGVVLVMTYHNAPRMKPMPLFMSTSKAGGGNDLPILQDPEIHWNGQPIAVVLAESQEQADYAKSLIAVTYERADAMTNFAAAKAAGTEPGEFQGEPLKLEIGDAEAALAAAAHRVDHVYRTPRHNHNPIELHAATVTWEGETLRVHDATQAVAHTAWSLAQIFGIDEKQVRVTSPFVGGGFGSKTLWEHQALAAAASKLAGRPVRIVLSREGVHRTIGGRAMTEQRVAIGAQADGTFDAIVHTGAITMSRHSATPEPFIVQTKSAYAAGAFKLDVEQAFIDMVANTFMRAPGEAVGTFGLESAIDELAVALDIDPIELRLKNEPAQDPTTGLPFSQRAVEQAFRDGAARFGWADRPKVPGSRREGDWLIGMGVATGTYPYYRMPGGAARITLDRNGHATVGIAAHEMGMGTATAHTQVTADRLGLSLDQVTFNYADTDLPGVVLAGGSQQTAAIGAAIVEAQRELFAELLTLAGNDSSLAGLKPHDVFGTRGGLAKLDEPDRYESYTSILSRAQREAVTVEATPPDPLELQHWSMHSHSAIFVEVRVNAVTGEVRVSRMLGSFDCGRILNPKTGASQFRGGMIMGLGLALTEETMFDERTGRIMNPSLAEYHVPVHLDVPAIEVMWTDIPDPRSPMGARGIGEIGITGVGAAVANAVYNATGKRIRELPITLDKLF